MKIAELQKEIHRNAVEKGFYEKPNDFGTDLMLITSELGECLEAHRKNEFADLEEFERLINSDDNKMTFEETFKKHMKDTVQDELADAFIRILDTAEFNKIELSKFVEYKMKYNYKRERLHGKQY